MQSSCALNGSTQIVFNFNLIYNFVLKLRYLFNLFIGLIVKESRIFLNESQHGQLIVNTIYKIEHNQHQGLNMSGIWTVNIYLEETVYVMSKRFLVLPTVEEFKKDSMKWLGVLDKFWKLSSICFHNNHSYINNNCESKAYWSSFYPDPKSNFTLDKLHVNLVNRILF
jgi:hypothetical protein